MKSFLSSISLLIISTSATSLTSINNRTIHNNLGIINGEKVKVGEFPWYGGQSYTNLSPTICNGGGVLIAPQWVLTAEHVAYPNPDDTPETFNFGIYNKKNPVNLETRVGTKLFNPNGDLNQKYHSDVALVKLNKAITDIKPVAIATPQQRAKPGQKVTICGFGDDAKGIPTDDFMKAQVTIQDPNLAKDPQYRLTKFEPFDGNYDFIVGTLSGTPQAAALGDSGGPLLQFINNQWVVQGVTSRGPGYVKGQSWALSIYAGVSEWYNWIQDTIKNN